MARGSHLAALGAALALSACKTDGVPPPAIEVRTVVKTVETMRPCGAAHPARPAKLATPLPTDLYALVIAVTKKLDEYAGPGRWADQMDSSLTTCTKP